VRNQARVEVIIVIGEHFAYVRDRPWPPPSFVGASGPGGPALVDYALSLLPSSTTDAPAGYSPEGQAMAVRYLDLEGSCGRLHPSYMDQFHADDSSIDNGNTGGSWIISRSTHPWREGKALWSYSSCSSTSHSAPAPPPRLTWSREGGKASVSGVEWRGSWTIMESSLSVTEMQRLFERYVPHSML